MSYFVTELLLTLFGGHLRSSRESDSSWVFPRFIVPISCVICNDIMAYMFGFFFGRTPLIKVSGSPDVGGGWYCFLCGMSGIERGLVGVYPRGPASTVLWGCVREDRAQRDPGQYFQKNIPRKIFLCRHTFMALHFDYCFNVYFYNIINVSL